jgi:acyl-CoA synthetase (AMP-forming)/AMP-acid ligase II
VKAGYLGRPDATAEMVDAAGWLHTGDLGHVDADGNVFVVDRLKELIRVSAYQAAPAELEALLAGHPAVADAAVIPRPDAARGEIPVALVGPSRRGRPRRADGLGGRPGRPHKRIRAVRLVDAIPRTSSGKPLRRVLIERDRRRV